ncbi:MAG: hypothetical protein IPO58_25145 [Betaproteobacteria bacterium]|nr:hypothetical protein [Betaproteobacteria bacterium]
MNNICRSAVGRQVLLVDGDDLMHRRGMRLRAGKGRLGGQQRRRAAGGAGADRATRPDIIGLDLMMPEMDASSS